MNLVHALRSAQMTMRFDTIKILDMLSLIHEDLDIDSVERRFFELTTQIFPFDRLALFFVKHRRGLLQGKLGHGFPPGTIEGISIPISHDFILTTPLITGVPAWNQTVDADPYVKALGLSNFAIIPVVNRKRVSCWEITACHQSSCPAFGNRWLRCWLVSDSHCSTGHDINDEQKLKKCSACPVYKESTMDCVEGVLLVDSSSHEPISDDTVMILSLIGHTVGAAINNSKHFQRTLIDSIQDDLTAIPNRRYFNERLVDELQRVSRYPKEPASLILIDIDFFKRVNDTLGHQAGDSVLIWFASFLVAKLRKSDIVARYGGEEFAILLINTSKSQATEVAEELRRGIESEAGPATGGIELTASFGVATFHDDAITAEGLIAKADKALYAAKAQGRNRVCQAS